MKVENKVWWHIGNLLDAKEEIIAHQVNAQGHMGSGLAGQLMEKYPRLRPSYKIFCKDESDGKPKNLLGKVFFYYAPDGKIIANIFGQLTYGYNKNVVYTDMNAFRQGLVTVGYKMKDTKKKLALPYKIGAGLANGSWKEIKLAIESWNSVTNDFTHVYAFKKEIVDMEDQHLFNETVERMKKYSSIPIIEYSHKDSPTIWKTSGIKAFTLESALRSMEGFQVGRDREVGYRYRILLNGNIEYQDEMEK
jgi:O-acetyl-ADP-ribose deacetylase (regulator of RNase III)